MIEPLYSLEVACELIPCDMLTLMNILGDVRFEARYHVTGARMLSEAECINIRNIIVAPKQRMRPTTVKERVAWTSRHRHGSRGRAPLLTYA